MDFIWKGPNLVQLWEATKLPGFRGHYWFARTQLCPAWQLLKHAGSDIKSLRREGGATSIWVKEERWYMTKLQPYFFSHFILMLSQCLLKSYGEDNIIFCCFGNFATADTHRVSAAWPLTKVMTVLTAWLPKLPRLVNMETGKLNYGIDTWWWCHSIPRQALQTDSVYGWRCRRHATTVLDLPPRHYLDSTSVIPEAKMVPS